MILAVIQPSSEKLGPMTLQDDIWEAAGTGGHFTHLVSKGGLFQPQIYKINVCWIT